MINVAIVDDHQIVREGFKQILADLDDVQVTGEAQTGKGLLELVQKQKFDVVVLDISLPDMNGIDVLKALKEYNSKLPVLILTMHDEEQYAPRLFKAGASGYLTKESVSEELVLAIRKVHSGGKFVSQKLAEKLVADMQHSRPVNHESLSDREFQVLCSIASGKQPMDIAKDLGLSIKTVSTYRSRIMEKIQLKNNAELIRYAIQNGLVKMVTG